MTVPFWQMLNFVQALIRFFKSDCPTVVRGVREHRLKICNECPSLNGGRCTECGCFVRLKTWCSEETCPKGYWPKWK